MGIIETVQKPLVTLEKKSEGLSVPKTGSYKYRLVGSWFSNSSPNMSFRNMVFPVPSITITQ